MKTKKITSIGVACLLIAGLSATLQAQQPRKCGSVENQTRLETLYPEIKKNQAAIEEHTQNYFTANAKESAVAVNIPVVVHVVYNTSAQNISDAQIQSQIAVLNEDFQKLNADKTLVPSAFASLAANTNISFCLATKDPSGNPTTGIVRKSTTSTSFIDDDKVKSSSTGGDDAWNSSKYLNLWVCNLGGGLLGYAQFPGGPAATDGVVILYTAFGRTGNVVAPYNKGRTATHEVGHWLNLRHIWGDANCGNDLVNDTPTQQAANYGCPTYPHITCSNSGDMSMNYMDYVDDACMYMFSAGQSARMNALFASGGARVGLLTSTGCGTTTTTTTTTTGTSNALTIGSGASSTGVVPYGTYYMDERAQIIVSQSELISAGYNSANHFIKSLGFNVVTANAQTMGNFTIKISHTSATSFGSTSFISGSNQTTVFSGNVATSSGQWNNHIFTTPFNYNGTDNILIDICWDNAAYNNNSTVYASTTTNYMTLYKRQDISTGGLCTTTSGTRTYTRPNMKLSFGSNSTALPPGSSVRLSDNGITTVKENETSIYPNPVKDKLTLTFNVAEENSNASIEVYNLFGSKVKSFDIESLDLGANTVEINLANESLQNGIYFLNLTVNGEKTTKKLILQN